ncbi:MAG TPA: DUF2071 domain-containing protein, partial [Pyrinomonadaceae bacterium]|nr:DUF2071 domain-containing protein [Pyrinomonadaceae bacterium]
MSGQIDRLSIRERPPGPPIMRQNWGKLLFMHWPVAERVLRPLLPERLTVDTFDGGAWLSVVPFTMWGIRPSFTPPLPGLSAMHELNVRTYVHLDGVPGVWFLSLDVQSAVATWAARSFYFLPYHTAEMSLRETGRKTVSFDSRRRRGDAPPAEFSAVYTHGGALPTSRPGSLEFFLTERYCLYSARRGQVYRALIHHPAWPLRAATLSAHRSTMVEALGLPTPQGEPLLQYCDAL